MRIRQRLTDERAGVVTSNFVVAETHALAIQRRGRDQALVVLRSLLSGAIRLERISPQEEAVALQIILMLTYPYPEGIVARLADEVVSKIG